MKRILFLIIVSMVLVNGCAPQQEKEVHPQWIKNAVLYEVNVRQITPEGTFAAFEQLLPRLGELGIDVLWFMPVHPIGVAGRKGPLGSYYSIKDYKAVNREFGTLEDFRSVVDKAHQLGMHVIMDWVAAHTSRDAVWLEHEDWHVRRPDGEPEFLYDWSDVARLNYQSEDMRAAMLDAMRFWVEDVDVDGFRCDMADLTPIDFWEHAVPELRKVKEDLFMLAESENPINTREAFHAYYGWRLHHTLNDVAQAKKDAGSIRHTLGLMLEEFGPNAIPLHFTSNHDENSWNGTEFERMGQATWQMAALTFALPGIPLIYTGQEVGNTKQLEFFEKDNLQPHEAALFTDFYTQLIRFKHQSPALQVPPYGGTVVEITHDGPENVFVFIREVEGNRILALFNFTDRPQSFRLQKGADSGTFTDWRGEEILQADENTLWELEPYGFRLFSKTQ
ncbi:MAG: alpha-amylase family glycosyl hydrolase [Bacteroidales bacterium]